jgi:hypothetical protein
MIDQPAWRGGETLAGRTILLRGEQGLGDVLQFCRYAPLVKALGARVILEVEPPLVRIMGSLPGVDAVVSALDPLPPFDVHCPLMSLPLAFGTTLSTIPAQVPYLFAEPEKAAAWRERLDRQSGGRRRLRVGLVWSGGRRPDQPALRNASDRRNIPLELLAPLKRVDAQFHSLQKGALAERALADLVARGWDGPQIVDHADQLRDLSDTAALMQNLDLVVSVCTSTAHLAGALGKPVFVLLRFGACWRWLLERSDSPWHPTARLFRQAAPDDWGPVAQALAAAVEEAAAKSR